MNEIKELKEAVQKAATDFSYDVACSEEMYSKNPTKNNKRCYEIDLENLRIATKCYELTKGLSEY